mmetsp:Transcript_25281/g.63301  ORF Transcript_25281/g.63301 Transcript_25281/m.63301 type:complete len:323 (-) Transcript_25281:2317-3285(-)
MHRHSTTVITAIEIDKQSKTLSPLASPYCTPPHSSLAARLPPLFGACSPLGGRAHEAGGVRAHLPEVAYLAGGALLRGQVLGAARGARHVLGAAVDRLESGAAHHKGVPAVVVELDLILGRALTRRKHLFGLLRHLDGRVELQQAPAESSSGVKVLELEEEGHGAAQRQAEVDGLQVGMREVRGELRLAVHIVLELLALDLDAKRRGVLARNAQELAHLVHLAPRLHQQHGDAVDDGHEQLERLPELPLGRGLVCRLELLLQQRQGRNQRRGRGGPRRVLRGPPAAQREGQRGCAGHPREWHVCGERGVDEVLPQRREVHDA